MKRGFVLAASILGLISSCLFLIFLLVGFFSLIAVGRALFSAGWSSGIGIVIIVYLLFFALTIPTLVLNALSIKLYSATYEEFKKKRGILIASIVFDLLLMILIILFVCSSVRYMMIVYSALAICMFLSFIFHIVALAKEPKLAAQTVQNVVTKTENIAPKQNKDDDIYEKIKKLAKLHDEKVISDEEFQKLKDQIINK